MQKNHSNRNKVLLSHYHFLTTPDCVLAERHLAELCAHLQVILRVPVRVEDDAGVCSRQVDPQTSCSGAQQEHEAVRVGFAEPVDGSLPQVSSDATVDSFIRVAEEKRPTSLNRVEVLGCSFPTRSH